MNALWQAEAKSNPALVGCVCLTCRAINALAQQGLLAPVAFVLDAQDVDLAVPDASGYVGVTGRGRHQPAGDAIGQLQQIFNLVDGPAHGLLVVIGELQELLGNVWEVLLAEDGNPDQRLAAGKPALHALLDFGVVVLQAFNGHVAGAASGLGFCRVVHQKLLEW